jgi:hypothetical protein
MQRSAFILRFGIKYCLVMLAVCMAFSSCAQQQKFNPVLKRQLDSIAIIDQKYREVLSNLSDPLIADKVAQSYSSTPAVLSKHLWVLQNHIDSLNVIFVETVIKQYGYPGTTLVGTETNTAAWLVIQHSKDINQYIPIIKQAADKNELPFSKYAMMYDRFLLNQNKEQVYGSQCTCRLLKTGKNECFVWPIQDAAHVNERRKKAGFTTTVEQNAVNLGVAYRVVKLDEVKL